MKQIETYKLFDPTNLAKGMPDEESGNYIFLLRPDVELPNDMIAEQPTFTTLKYNGKEYRVLYTGITKDSLYKRVYKIHLTGNNAGKSTLRKSLGCLWGYTFVKRDKKPDSTKTKFSETDEVSITEWMSKNLLVLYVANKNFGQEEQELIDTFNPPLNLDKNDNVINMEYRQRLKMLRARKIGQ
ncbi:MAG: hypothetical protein IJ183_06810 [Prevotella sp.]|nr:hypothetical protein [Prevotella sp.]